MSGGAIVLWRAIAAGAANAADHEVHQTTGRTAVYRSGYGMYCVATAWRGRSHRSAMTEATTRDVHWGRSHARRQRDTDGTQGKWNNQYQGNGRHYA